MIRNCSVFILLSLNILAYGQTTYSVTNTNDAGAGSLRQAILDANSNAPTAAIIIFNISGGGPWTITLASILPTLNTSIVIDATTQPGWNNCNVILDGTNTIAIGLQITTLNSEIYGLTITNFVSRDIHINGNNFKIGAPNKGNVINKAAYCVYITGGSNGKIQGNKIGTNASGTAAVCFSVAGITLTAGDNILIGGSSLLGEGNLISGQCSYAFGINIQSDNVTNTIIHGNKIGTNAAGTAAISNSYGVILFGGINTLIGGSAVGDGNLISGSNPYAGIYVRDAKGTVIKGNMVGTDITGTLAIPNIESGIAVGYGITRNTTIGGSGAGDGNLISGNSGDGIGLGGPSGSSLYQGQVIIQGNKIGTTITGTSPLPNNKGINCGSSSFSGYPLDSVVIGGTNVSAGNIIAYNYNSGIIISGVASKLDPVRLNSIFCNGNQGIDLNSAANNNKLSPVITGATDCIGAWGTSEPFDTIEVFIDNVCNNDQGKVYVGTTAANNTGNWLLLTALTVGDKITATATSATNASIFNNTSEFSQKFIVTSCSVSSITVTIAITVSVTCNGGNDGSLSAIVIGGTPPYTYNWSNGKTTASISGLLAGTYTLVVTDNASNIITHTIALTQPTPVLLAVTVSDATCNQSNGVITTSVSGGTPLYIYKWNDGTTNKNRSNLSAGSYTLTVTDANGCTTSIVSSISNSPAVAVNILITGTITCTGAYTGAAVASISGGTSPYTYHWSNGVTNAGVTDLAAGTYSVLVSDSNGCTAINTVNIAAGANSLVAIVSGNTSIAMGDSTTLSSSGGVTYQWSPATGLSCITCANPSASPLSTTYYCVTVSDNNGCRDSACVTVNVEVHCDLYIPTAFSPNSDNVNETECVYSATCFSPMSFKVFDRWGEIVFQTTDPNPEHSGCWNGIYKGKRMDTDVFYYIFEGTNINGETIFKKGTVYLIR